MTIGLSGNTVLDGPRTEYINGAVKRKPLQAQQQVNADGSVEMAIADGFSFSQITKQADGRESEERGEQSSTSVQPRLHW